MPIASCLRLSLSKISLHGVIELEPSRKKWRETVFKRLINTDSLVHSEPSNCAPKIFHFPPYLLFFFSLSLGFLSFFLSPSVAERERDVFKSVWWRLYVLWWRFHVFSVHSIYRLRFLHNQSKYPSLSVSLWFSLINLSGFCFFFLGYRVVVGWVCFHWRWSR